ncbi:Yip1 family protein [Alteromonas facilis]|uniref:Yip1 family protein n=1 Tax=Alteromonas facilis TaxID=2048004 RepID=UPI000C292500|nr:Yip1 family protein [Alteromonas facilis]
MSQVSNPLQACSEIFFKPNGVFAAINVKHNWSWLPFILVIAMAVIPSYLYFNFVDFEWYKDLIIQSTYADASPNEQNMVRSSMTPQGLTIFSTLGGLVGYLLINAVLATYLNLMTRNDESNTNGFTDWYGFTWWVSMPVIFSALVALFVIAFATDHQLSPVSLSPTSLAFLLGMNMDSDWFGLAQTVRLESFWTIYLMTVGISQWTSFNTQRALITASIPYALLWSIWTVSIILF